MTLSGHIRAHAAEHPEMTPSERARVLALELGRPVSRQAVQRALGYVPTGQPVGRPRTRVPKSRCPTCGRPGARVTGS